MEAIAIRLEAIPIRFLVLLGTRSYKPETVDWRQIDGVPPLVWIDLDDWAPACCDGFMEVTSLWPRGQES